MCPLSAEFIHVLKNQITNLKTFISDIRSQKIIFFTALTSFDAPLLKILIGVTE